MINQWKKRKFLKENGEEKLKFLYLHDYYSIYDTYPKKLPDTILDLYNDYLKVQTHLTPSRLCGVEMMFLDDDIIKYIELISLNVFVYEYVYENILENIQYKIGPRNYSITENGGKIHTIPENQLSKEFIEMVDDSYYKSEIKFYDNFNEMVKTVEIKDKIYVFKPEKNYYQLIFPSDKTMEITFHKLIFDFNNIIRNDVMELSNTVIYPMAVKCLKEFSNNLT
jgi:hypothetical protein